MCSGLLLLLLSCFSTFYLLTYTIAIFNINQCMVELWDFLPKVLEAFLIQLVFVLFQFKCWDVSLCWREEVAPFSLCISNSSQLSLWKKIALGYLSEILVNTFQIARHSKERYLGTLQRVIRRQKAPTDLLQCLSTYPQTFNSHPLKHTLHLPL